MGEHLYYVCDMRKEWLNKPYVSFWRPDDQGYAYPLSWSGKYEFDRLAANPNYYWSRNTRSFLRFPVACSLVERIAVPPMPKTIDKDAGPVVLMNKAVRAFLRASMLPMPSVVGSAGIAGEK